MGDDDWLGDLRRQHFPADLHGSFTLHAVPRAEAMEVVGTLYDDVFTAPADLGLFSQPAERLAAAEQIEAELTRHVEHFVFRREGEPVGWSFGYQKDSDTFFMSFSGVHPTSQRQGVYAAFVAKLLPYLRDCGYERVTSNHMVNNNPVIIAKLKLGFVINGITLDERWGAVVDLVRYVHDDRHAGFRSAFSLDE